jgi:hypothetical protein
VRCTSTGRTCDGYVQEQPVRDIAFRPARTAPTTDVIVRNPNVVISADTTEQRGFYFFQTVISRELSEAFQSDFWHGTVLQMSHTDPTIMHSAIALGLIGERLQINEVLTDENPVANARHFSAQVQYQKAITQFVKQLNRSDDSSLRSTLICCLVLICFEFLQGNEEGALVHLKSGLNILENYWTSNASLQVSSQTSARGWSDLDDMIRIFGVLDVQASNWLGLSSYISPGTIPLMFKLMPKSPTPKAFASIEEAGQHLQANGINIYYFQRLYAVDPVSATAKESAEKLAIERKFILEDLDKWKLALEGFLRNQGSALSLDDKIRSDVLCINWTTICIRIAADFEVDEFEYYGQFDKEFAATVFTVTPLLWPVNVPMERNLIYVAADYNPATDMMPLFSFCMGIIEPLFFVATRCHDAAVAEQALDLLTTNAWREGAWDSAAMAKIAVRRRRQLFAEKKRYGITDQKYVSI